MRGVSFGSFVIEAQLGASGLGETWSAMHPAGHRVVIKLLRPELSSRPLEQLCFPEAHAISRLADASIAKVFDAGRATDGRGYVISSFIPGESLAARIARGRHSLTQVADLS